MVKCVIQYLPGGFLREIINICVYDIIKTVSVLTCFVRNNDNQHYRLRKHEHAKRMEKIIGFN